MGGEGLVGLEEVGFAVLEDVGFDFVLGAFLGAFLGGGVSSSSMSCCLSSSSSLVRFRRVVLVPLRFGASSPADGELSSLYLGAVDVV